MLTEPFLRSLKPGPKPYSHQDGGGLSIEVTPSGTKRWCYRYRVGGKAERVIIGKYPALTSATARVERDKLAAQVAAGESPARQKRLAKVALAEATTVAEFAERFFRDEVVPERREPKGIRRYLDQCVLPAIGSKLVRDITTEDVRQIIWLKKDHGHDAAAGELRGLLKRLFDYALTFGLVKLNPVLALPMKHVFRAKARERALEKQEIGTVMRTVYNSNMRRQFKLALHIILITLVRKSELMFARWEHVDLESKEWFIPKENSKTNTEHIVYLSDQAVTLFEELKQLCFGSEYVLPGRGSTTRPFAHNALNKALRDAFLSSSIPHFTVHDLRRTASTRLHEEGWNSDVIEKALNHTIGGVRGVYNRAKYATQRREMLQFWANYVDALTLVDGKLIVANFKRASGDE